MFTNTVRPETLELLKKLMSEPLLTNHRLVGGTALALMFGHRESIDLDLFTNEKQNPKKIEQILLKDKYLLQEYSVGEDGFAITCQVNSVKVDFVSYPYKWLEDELIIDNIRFATLNDISAMKVSAIGQRGSKKDFYDLALILDHLTIYQIMDNFKKRFNLANDFHYLQSLTYFVDAEKDFDPISTELSLAWDKVKNKIIEAVKPY